MLGEKVEPKEAERQKNLGEAKYQKFRGYQLIVNFNCFKIIVREAICAQWENISFTTKFPHSSSTQKWHLQWLSQASFHKISMTKQAYVCVCLKRKWVRHRQWTYGYQR